MASADLSKLDQEFVSKAAEDGLVEIEMAKLAQKKGGSSELKSLADTMLSDHSDTKEKLQKLAGKMGVSLPKEPSGEHRKLLDEMSGYDGEEFEQRFISTVIAEHEKDVNLFHSESEHGGNDALKQFAGETAPILEKHLESARSIQSRY